MPSYSNDYDDIVVDRDEAVLTMTLTAPRPATSSAIRPAWSCSTRYSTSGSTRLCARRSSPAPVRGSSALAASTRMSPRSTSRKCCRSSTSTRRSTPSPSRSSRRLTASPSAAGTCCTPSATYLSPRRPQCSGRSGRWTVDAGYGSWYLEDTIGRKRAKEMWYLNKKYTAAEALGMGLVNEVVPAAELLDRAREVAHTISTRSPIAIAIGAMKTAFSGRHNGVSGQARMAHDQFLSAYLTTNEAHEMSAAFAEKRAENRQILRSPGRESRRVPHTVRGRSPSRP
jgi:hypothetical protein